MHIRLRIHIPMAVKGFTGQLLQLKVRSNICSFDYDFAMAALQLPVCRVENVEHHEMSMLIVQLGL